MASLEVMIVIPLPYTLFDVRWDQAFRSLTPFGNLSICRAHTTHMHHSCCSVADPILSGSCPVLTTIFEAKLFMCIPFYSD